MAPESEGRKISFPKWPHNIKRGLMLEWSFKDSLNDSFSVNSTSYNSSSNGNDTVYGSLEGKCDCLFEKQQENNENNENNDQALSENTRKKDVSPWSPNSRKRRNERTYRSRLSRRYQKFLNRNLHLLKGKVD